ncbi:hypothetical protein A4A49_51560, partial [Nicotiana attenuata]
LVNGGQSKQFHQQYLSNESGNFLSLPKQVERTHKKGDRCNSDLIMLHYFRQSYFYCRTLVHHKCDKK